jgi:hypothetical protein
MFWGTVSGAGLTWQTYLRVHSRCDDTVLIGPDTVLLRPRGDRVPQLSEIAWNEDRLTAVLVCDGAAQNVVFTYDVRRNHAGAAQLGESLLRRTLATRYALTGAQIEGFGGDPLGWACDSAEAERRFRDEFRGGRTLERFAFAALLITSPSDACASG